MLFGKTILPWACLPLIAGFSLPPLQASFRWIDESESGRLLTFEESFEGELHIRIDEQFVDDYPGFSVEDAPLAGVDVTIRIDRTSAKLSPAVWKQASGWSPIDVLESASGFAFHVRVQGARTVLRLWGDKDEAGSLARGHGGDAPGFRSLSQCVDACYAPENPFCYDFRRIRCHVNFVARQPHVRVGLLGWTQPCSGEESTHWPREIYKLRITNESVPLNKKVRILLTSRAHGGERLASFIVEGIIDYALGLPVVGEGGLLSPVPPRPADLLEKLDILVYPCLNPDGSSDLDGDGLADFDRLKCGIDMNRRWGTPAEATEAREVYLVHQDILAEAKLQPFRYHRDFHGWGRSVQGGIRHGVGAWVDGLGFEAIHVSEQYFEQESSVLEAEHAVIPYRNPGNYLVGTPGDPPTPGTARFALYRELSETGLISNTSESSWIRENGKTLSDPSYLSGDDLRLEGAWLLHAWYHRLPSLGDPPKFQYLRGDSNADGKVNLSDVVEILSYLFRGSLLYCREPADLDENGEVLLSDAVYLIAFAFLGGPTPPAPYPVCAESPNGNPGDCTTRPSSCL